MARSLFLAAGLVAAFAAAPAAAQERRPETAAEAGLRYLDWPGRPPVARAEPPRPPRPDIPRPGRPTPPPLEPAAEQPSQPSSPVQARVEAIGAPATTSDDDGPRYYSVHRGAGRTPDPIPEARVLAADDTLVALRHPEGQTLAEQDRTARAEEAFEILRSLPPDQLMDMLDRAQ